MKTTSPFQYSIHLIYTGALVQAESDCQCRAHGSAQHEEAIGGAERTVELRWTLQSHTDKPSTSDEAENANFKTRTKENNSVTPLPWERLFYS